MTSITWVRLILQPFRYLNSIVNSEKLCERLFDIVFSCPDRVVSLKKLIIIIFNIFKKNKIINFVLNDVLDTTRSYNLSSRYNC